ncbi:MAG: T9SS type A sorting domain-containing protein [Ignavibacteria bacterium]|nr:T9SS type A sorting domain-containing protein [Ignavibacteria bacterium]
MLYGDVSVSGGMIRLNGADRVRIDGRFSGSGRYFRFRNNNTAQPVFTLLNDASADTVRNCFIESGCTSTGAIVIGAGVTTGNDNTVIAQNVIRDRTDITTTPLYAGIFSNTASSSYASAGATISDNEIVNPTSYGMYLNSTSIGDAWSITGNSVYFNHPTLVARHWRHLLRPRHRRQRAHGLRECHRRQRGELRRRGLDQRVHKHLVRDLPLRGADGPDVSVQNNTVANFSFTATGALSFNGIYIGAGMANIGTVTGNTIGHASTSNSITASGTGDMRGIYSASADPVQVKNNLVANISIVPAAATTGTRGIEVNGSTGSITIANNEVRNLSTTSNSVSAAPTATTALYGILLLSNATGHLVENNLVTGLTSTPATPANTVVFGINVGSGAGTVRLNKITGLVNNSSSAAPVVAGIWPSSGSWTVANNMISLGSGITGNVAVAGIRDAGTSTLTYAYNAVAVMGSAGAGSNNSYAFLRASTSSSTLRNNILLNERTGGSGYHYAIGTPSTTNWLAGVSDYNLLVTADPDRIGEWGASAPVNRNLANWKTSSSGDTYSFGEVASALSSTALFSSPSTGDLHVSTGVNSWYANGNGIALSTVTTDYDGDSRSASIAGGATDIGADEFTPGAAPAVLAATPSSGGTNVFTFAGRTLASLTWGTGGTVPSSVSLQFYSGTTPPSPTTGNYGNVYWNITASGGSGFTYDATLNYTRALLGTIGSESSTRMAKRDGGVWTHFPTSVLNMTLKTVTETGLTSFSDFALSDNTNPLPVQLVAFTAVKKGDAVELRWRTASELNSLRFGVERRAGNGDAWTEIGSVGSIGSVDHETSYQFTDAELPKADELYYRLRKIDRDGTFDFSNEVRVALATPAGFEVFASFPNPFVSSTAISFALPQEQFVTVRVYDASGRIVESLIEETLPAGTHTATFHAQDLPNGAYQYVITAGGETKAGTMILAR